MPLNTNLIRSISEWAKSDFEAGHPVEDYKEFSKLCREMNINCNETLYQIYLDNLAENI